MRYIAWISFLLYVTTYFTICVADAKTALIIVDVQYCFLSGGSLAVTNGDDVIPVINNIRSEYEDKFSLVVLTQDWHCVDHVSFQSQHPGSPLYSQVVLQYDSSGNLCQNNDSCEVAYNVSQTLWPDHCVMNTKAANFSSTLTRRPSDIVVRKGYHCQIDSYSGFYDNGDFSETELKDELRSRNISRVLVTGLALDYCVFYTASDAKQLGFDTYLIKDASKPVANNTAVTALEQMKNTGVHIITSNDVGTLLGVTSSANTVTSCLGAVFLSVLATSGRVK